MENRNLKVLILTCGTGEGHNSSAKAIRAKLVEKGLYCEVKDVLTFKGEKTAERVAGMYKTVINRVPRLFGVAFRLGKLYDDMRLPSPIYSANERYADKLCAYIRENGFDCVVCTHLFAMQAMTAVRANCGLFVRCYGVMTDYIIHPFVKDSDLDGYFLPNEEVLEQFLKKGFSRDKLFITGIPVHPKFSAEISKREARHALGLPQDKKIAVILSGGSGCGKIEKLCKSLNKAFDGGHLFVILTGRNEKLKKRLETSFGGSGKFTAVGFTTDVHLYLRASDVALSKSGGLSSTEIAVANVPLVHLKAIPGLETANLKYFSENGLSLRADTVKRAVKELCELFEDGATREAMRKIQRARIRVGATEIITRYIVNDDVYLDTADNGRLPCGEYDVLQDNPETNKA